MFVQQVTHHQVAHLFYSWGSKHSCGHTVDTHCSVYIHLIPIEVSHPIIVSLGFRGTHTT